MRFLRRSYDEPGMHTVDTEAIVACKLRLRPSSHFLRRYRIAAPFRSSRMRRDRVFVVFRVSPA